MRSGMFELTVDLTKLGSGHRMADIIRPLEQAPAVPRAALERFPFLTAESFQFKGGMPQQMSEFGM
eukprot:8198524-Pyramimonas_sp.AAC.1